MFDDKPVKNQSVTKPPEVMEVLIEIIKKWHDSGKRSAHAARNPHEQAQWWIRHQEPPQEFLDRPEELFDHKTGRHSGWRTPYHDRLASNLRKFLSLSEIEKAFVVDCIKSGCPYRGNDIPMLKMIRIEHDKMLANPESYKEKAFKILGTLTRNNQFLTEEVV